ncbi:MAG: hypothetical protein JSV39_02095 [Candidatus Aenigmatarchaeota archaeon]|nr:MAG: hypothetical protein JSV39_02095 [Candidatus Aenigmarchaeota archaeon]
MEQEDIRKECEKYKKIGTSELLSKTFFKRDELFYVSTSGLSKKDFKIPLTQPSPCDLPETPDSNFNWKFRFIDANGKWRRGCAKKCYHKDYTFIVEIGDLYVPPLKKLRNSVYGKTLTKLKNFFSDPL